jgi:hypothetical protein
MATKALGLWLFIVAIVWTFGFVWMHLTMTGFTDTVLPLPLHLALGFAGPFVLIVASALLMTAWHPQLGSILALVACAWLTYQLGPDCVLSIVEPRQPLQAPKLYWPLFSILTFLVLADLGGCAGLPLCSQNHLTKRWSELPPSGRSHFK